MRDEPPLPPLPPIGAHVSTSGGLLCAVDRAAALHAEAIQFFPSNPRTWRITAYPPEEIAALAEALEARRLPLFLHATYLVNLASPDHELRDRSAAAVAHALAFGAAAGATAVVTHVGSHRGDGFDAALPRVAASVSSALEVAGEALGRSNPRGAAGPGTSAKQALPPLLLETSAGAGASLGRDPLELGRLLEVLPSGTGICVDTAHVFAAGFAIHTPDGLDAYLASLDAEVGLDRVGLVHLNDSRRPFASKTDQHENVGEGNLGMEGLRGVITAAALRRVPFVLEVPGFHGHGPDARNMARARYLRRSLRPIPGDS